MSLRVPPDLAKALDEERVVVRSERPGEAISRADVLRALAYEALRARQNRRDGEIEDE
jgi:hypothetical protein